MEQTINFLAELEQQLEDIDKARRAVKYPPLNGGPTIEDLSGLLKGAAATIKELSGQVDEAEETSERCDELQDAINEAIDKLEDIVLDLESIPDSADSYYAWRRTVEAPITQLRCVYSDLRRA